MRETKEEMYAEAQRRMEGFTYTLEAGSDTAEIWTCKKPNDSYYAFQLSVGRYGMSMFGDAGSLCFNVGSYYGIPFLTHQDKHYVYNKLDSSSRETEFDEEYFKRLCVEWATDAICEKISDDVQEETLDMLEAGRSTGTYLPFNRMSEFIYEKYMSSDVMSDKYDFWLELDAFIDGAHYVSNSHDGYTLVEEYSKTLGDVYYGDYTLNRPSYDTMIKLWMLHVAAENILRIKNAN